ncbi:phosphoglycerate mutase [Angustibacter aerolatus]|uniref:Phosphoglycerate mutase n=1 Tax=Angustibacter aerolatus TaxID=1162965 RepID=A0ABQ6JM26_9ACTN|nr:histidine phosphatase family protein [Angustibacter aerolatus]GMA87902.1 phosphoglycerate mutase [Angustibacter aerolatus]
MPLSDVGQAQATHLGRHLVTLDAPDLVVSSPMRRAADTAAHSLAALPTTPRIVVDERLRERDLGLFDGLTGDGIRAEFPDEAERRTKVGKFYYRPPGGESWTDVLLRVRSVLLTLATEHEGEDVWLFSHQAVIACFRIAIEGLTEQEALETERRQPLANCSVGVFEDDGTRLVLQRWGDASAVEDAPVPTTHERESAGRHE